MIKTYRDLEVYKKAYQASLEIHEITLRFPSFETYELGSQIRRASKGIPMNIAEGFGKNDTEIEFKRYLKIAIGSCDEIQVQLEYCRDLKYMSKEEYEKYRGMYEEIGKMLNGMRNK